MTGYVYGSTHPSPGDLEKATQDLRSAQMRLVSIRRENTRLAVDQERHLRDLEKFKEALGVERAAKQEAQVVAARYQDLFRRLVEAVTEPSVPAPIDGEVAENAPPRV